MTVNDLVAAEALHDWTNNAEGLSDRPSAAEVAADQAEIRAYEAATIRRAWANPVPCSDPEALADVPF